MDSNKKLENMKNAKMIQNGSEHCKKLAKMKKSHPNSKIKEHEKRTNPLTYLPSKYTPEIPPTSNLLVSCFNNL